MCSIPENSTVGQDDLIVEKIEPPEVALEAHFSFIKTKLWLVVAKNRRVNRDWIDLIQRNPQNSLRCYDDLCSRPTYKQVGRVFELRGKPYKGAWEYEVSKGDRVFYTVDEEKKKVIVYYAGKHPKITPTP